ncbi:MAG: class I SAM-dependent DNA methyltransferase [Promethearchaeota archaeon]
MTNVTKELVTETFINHFSEKMPILERGAIKNQKQNKSYKPAFVISVNNCICFGEAVWENSLEKGFAQTVLYSQLGEATSSFLILYPTDLKKEKITAFQTNPINVLAKYKFTVWFLTSNYPPTTEALTFGELADWLIKQIQKPDSVSDSDRIIELLQNLVKTLSSNLIATRREIFSSILAGNEKIDKRTLSSVGAYLLVNQLLFYQILASVHPELEPFEPKDLSSTEEIKKQFNKVLEINYEGLFSFNVIDTVKSLESIKKAIIVIKGLKPELLNQDFMGKVFHRLIPYNLRKKLASFYTKANSAEILAEFAINDPHAKIIDPACGSGTLLVAAYQKKRSLIPEFSEKDHKQFLAEEITGIDVMAFSAHLTVINLVMQYPISETGLVRIAIRDSTTITSKSEIGPLSAQLPSTFGRQLSLTQFYDDEKDSPEVETGAISIARQKHSWKVGTFDVVMMNPPYTRKQTLIQFGKTYRQELMKRFEKDYKGIISSNSPFYQFFILIADRLLKKSGRIAAVIPTTFLRAEDATKIRQWILKNYRIQFIVVRVDYANLSEDTSFREMLFIADKGEPQKDHELGIIFLKKPDKKLVITIKTQIEANRNSKGKKEADLDKFRIRWIPQRELNPENFFRKVAFFSLSLEQLWRKVKRSPILVKLDPDRGEGNITIRAKGTPTPTGINFEKMAVNAKETPSEVLGKDLWVLEAVTNGKIKTRHRKANKVVSIDTSAFMPHFRRIPYKTKMDVSSLEEYVLRNPSRTTINNFLQYSDIKTINWDKWHSFLDKGTSYLGFVDRLNISAPGSSLFAWYSAVPRAWARIPASIGGLTKFESKFLCLWFNSTFNIIQYLYERNETQGAWIQLHKYIIEDFRVPKIELTTKHKSEVEQLFNELGQIEFPSILEQFVSLTKKLKPEFEKMLNLYYPKLREKLNQGFKPREILDAFFERLLGIDIDWDKIYSSLLIEILILRRIMDVER